MPNKMHNKLPEELKLKSAMELENYLRSLVEQQIWELMMSDPYLEIDKRTFLRKILDFVKNNG